MAKSTATENVNVIIGNKALIEWDAQRSISSAFTHSTTVSPGSVRVNADGFYQVEANITFDVPTTGTNRVHTRASVWVNGVEEDSTIVSGYGRGDTGGKNMLISTLLELSPNDIIQIYAWTDDSAVAQVCPTVPEDCELNITQISGAAAAAGPQGPQGATGADGPEGATGVGIDGATGADGLQGATGADGATGLPGTGITLIGTVPTVNDLPLTNNNVGDLYIVAATGDGYAWDGSQWNNVGPIQGPIGPNGATGASGIEGPQGATGADGVEGATGPAGGGFFALTAETRALVNNRYFSFGANDNANNGAIIAEDCILRYLSLSTEFPLAGTAQIEVIVNGVNSGVIATLTNGNQETTSPQSSFAISAGDRVTIRVVSPPTTTTNGSVATATFVTSGAIGDMGATGPVGDPGGATGATGFNGDDGATGLTGTTGATGAQGPEGATGLSGPFGPQGLTGASGAEGPQGATGIPGTGITLVGTVPTVNDLPLTNNNVGDLYIVAATGDGYAWDGSQWNNVGAIQGPIGPQGATGADGATGLDGPQGATGAAPFTPSYIRCILNQVADINTSNNVFIPYQAVNTTPQFQSGDYTVASDGIEVSAVGIYKVSTTVYMTSAAPRVSVAMKYTINGSSATCDDIAAMGYIRGSNSHDSSSITLSTLLSLSAGDKVDLTFARQANAGAATLEGANSSINIERIA